MKQKLEPQKKIYYTIVLSLLLCMAITITLVPSFLYVKVKDILLNQIHTSRTEYLEQARHSTDYMTEYVKTLALQMYFDPESSKLLFLNDFDWFEYQIAYARMNYFRTSTPFIHSMYIYNSKSKNFIISTPYDQNNVQDENNFTDKEIVNLVRNFKTYKNYNINNNNTIFFPRLLSIDTGNGNKLKDYIYTLAFRDVSNAKYTSTVILNISAHWMRETVNALCNDDSNSIFAIDDSGKVMIENNNYSVMHDLSKESWIKEVLLSKNLTGHFIGEVNNKKMIINYTKPAQSFNKWIFLSVQPYDLVISRISNVKNYTILVSLIVFIAVIILIYFLSKKIYQPIDNMAHKLKKLETYKDNNFSVTKNNCLRVFLQYANAKNVNEIMEELNEYSLSIDLSKPYIFMLIKIYDYNELASKYDYKQVELFKYAIIDTVQKYLREYSNLEAVNLPDCYLGMLINSCGQNCDLDNKFFKYLEDQLGNIRNDIYENYNIKFSVFISSTEQEYFHIQKTYKKLMEISKQTLKYGKECTILTSRLQNNQQQLYIYPEKKAEQLRESLMSGQDYERAKIIFDEIINEVLTYSYYEIKLCISNLICDVTKIINHLNRNAKYDSTSSVDRIINSFESYDYIEDINTAFYNLFEDITSYQKSQQNDNHYKNFIIKVDQVIKDNFSDPSFCTGTIADDLKMSTTYLGRLYKQLTLNSLPDYINDYRLYKACEMLLNSDKSVSEISTATGFSSAQYFHRVFKKKYNVTPSEYRNSENTEN